MTEEFIEASLSIPESAPKGDEAVEALPLSSVEAPVGLCIVGGAGIAWPFAGIAAIEKNAETHAAEKQATRDRRAP
jgi:hypothetical protein